MQELLQRDRSLRRSPALVSRTPKWRAPPLCRALRLQGDTVSAFPGRRSPTRAPASLAWEGCTSQKWQLTEHFLPTVNILFFI